MNKKIGDSVTKPKGCSKHLFSLPARFCHAGLHYLLALMPYFYILGSGKEEVLGRGAGLLPEPKYALDGEFSLVFKNVYTFYNRYTESHN